jgi:hypothetical protein
MKTFARHTARLLTLTVATALCGAPELLQAQSTASPPATQDTQQSQPPGGMVDPSTGPLQPIPPSTTLPDAPAAQQEQAPAAEQPKQPLGTAVGQQGVTVGGPASTPAGAAIAPAKQRQYRSLLIKIGALAAAGATVGAVVALTRSSPSHPPGAK